MRPLAEFIMRGRTQATLVVVLGAVVPLLYWMTAAGGSLVLLRRGPAAAAGVLVWALLPALFWLYLGDASIVLVLLGSTLLAAILRQSLSWTRVLLASVPLGLVFALVLGQVYAEGIAQLAEEIRRLLPQVLGPSAAQLPPEKQAQLQQLLLPVLTGLMAAFFQITCLLCLMLGRYWQAALYNPQGFGREFRVLRLRPAIALGLLALLVLAPNLGAAWPADPAVQRAAGLCRHRPAARAGGGQAPGRILAGGAVRDAAAVRAADLSVVGDSGCDR